MFSCHTDTPMNNRYDRLTAPWIRAVSVALVVLGLFFVVARCHAESEARTRMGLDDRIRNYNLRLGAVALDFRGQALVYGDDNPKRLPSGSTESLRLEYGVDVGVYWPIHPRLQLDTRIFLGYAAPLSGTPPTGLILRSNEGTALALDWKVGDHGLVSLTDTVHADAEAGDQGTDDDDGSGSELRMLRNDLALQYEVKPARAYHFTLRGGRQTIRSLNATFRHRDQDIDSAALRFDWLFRRFSSIGPYLSYRSYRHRTNQHNDAVEWEAGMNWQGKIRQTGHFELVIGYQVMNFSFDNVPEAREEDRGLTAKFAVSQQVSRHISHGLTAKYALRMGWAPLINYTRDATLGYRFDWDLTRRLHLSVLSRLLRSDQSGISGAMETGWSNEAQLRYRLRKTLIFGGLRHVERWSNAANRNYQSNQFTMGMYYDF